MVNSFPSRVRFFLACWARSVKSWGVFRWSRAMLASEYNSSCGTNQEAGVHTPMTWDCIVIGWLDSIFICYTHSMAVFWPLLMQSTGSNSAKLDDVYLKALCVSVLHMRATSGLVDSNHVSHLSHLQIFPGKDPTRLAPSTNSETNILVQLVFCLGSAPVFRGGGLSVFYKPSREQSGDSKPWDHVAIFILALFIVLIMPYNTHMEQRYVVASHIPCQYKTILYKHVFCKPGYFRSEKWNGNYITQNYLMKPFYYLLYMETPTRHACTKSDNRSWLPSKTGTFGH